MLRLDDSLNDISIFIVGGQFSFPCLVLRSLTFLATAFAALRLYAIFGRDWRVLIPMLAIALSRVIISIVSPAFHSLSWKYLICA